jgi:hypothetical protein
MDRNEPDTLLTVVARVEGFEEFMALIEIPNVYNSDMAVGAAAWRRFAVIGEPIVAVDLINTVAAPGSPAGNDLLSAERGARPGGGLRARVPLGDLPDIRALRQLRSALRDMIEALVDGRPVPQASLAGVRQARVRQAGRGSTVLVTGLGGRARPPCSTRPGAWPASAGSGFSAARVTPPRR